LFLCLAQISCAKCLVLQAKRLANNCTGNSPLLPNSLELPGLRRSVSRLALPDGSATNCAMPAALKAADQIAQPISAKEAAQAVNPQQQIVARL
jgi:hypothetical protein